MSNQYTVRLNQQQLVLVLAGLGSLRLFADNVPGTEEQRLSRQSEIQELALLIDASTENETQTASSELTNREATIVALAIAAMGELFAAGHVEDDVGLNIKADDIKGLDEKLLLSDKHGKWMAGDR